jgi:hypothetical protein
MNAAPPPDRRKRLAVRNLLKALDVLLDAAQGLAAARDAFDMEAAGPPPLRLLSTDDGGEVADAR